MEINDDYSKKIGLKISKYRISQGLTLKDLSSKVGFSPSYISELENGVKKSTDIETLCEIAVALNVTIDNLLSDCLNKYENTLQNIQEEKINLILDTLSDEEIRKFAKTIVLIKKYRIKLLSQ